MNGTRHWFAGSTYALACALFGGLTSVLFWAGCEGQSPCDELDQGGYVALICVPTAAMLTATYLTRAQASTRTLGTVAGLILGAQLVVLLCLVAVVSD